jgi:hypothetical protein
MRDKGTNIPMSENQRQCALSRWDNEGGAGPDGPQEGSNSEQLKIDVAQPANIELAQLRIRMIALENLVITLLAEASDRQLNLAGEMAAFISPRPGFTPHSITVRAASQMKNLIERSVRFRVKKPS